MISVPSQRFQKVFAHGPLAHVARSNPPPKSARADTFQCKRFTTFLSELTKLLGQHGAGSSSEDLALDLLLHDIVSQACSSTNAAAAAIALKRNGEFICRATCGECAPELGSHLSADTGLSGACIQSGEVQRCDDTDADTRVDAAACRRLGVRSVIVVPLSYGDEVAGVLEVFSPHAHIFTDGDVKTLISLSQRTMETISPPVKEEVKEEKDEESTTSAESFVVNPMAVQPHRDPWTTVLAVLIVALALLLGWMLGHRGLRKDVGRGNSSTGDVDSVKAAAPAGEPSPAPASPPRTADKPASAPKVPAAAPGSLSVYENGKIVFEVKPAPGSANSIAVQVPPDAANSLLIERVEPQYPDQARLSHIQGTVLLEVDVNEKGAVQRLSSLSGDPHLVTAAIDAVRQWHFKPYAPRGEALNFQTQVTVDFKLP